MPGTHPLSKGAGMDMGEIWRKRAMACELLAASLRYPERELAEAICAGEWLAAAEAVGLGDRANLIEDGPIDEGLQADELFHSLRAEATRLFIGAPRPVLSPYEGPFRAGAKGLDPVMFVNRHSLEVEAFCRACGYGQPAGTNEPLDHVATELELLQNLAVAAFYADNEMASERDGDPGRAFPGGSAASAYRMFREEHASMWFSDFADGVLENTRCSFYRATARCLKAFCAASEC